MSYPHDVSSRKAYLELYLNFHRGGLSVAQAEEYTFLEMIEENNHKIKIYEKRDPHHYGELVNHLKLSNKTLMEMLNARYVKNPELFKYAPKTK